MNGKWIVPVLPISAKRLAWQMGTESQFALFGQEDHALQLPLVLFND